VHYNTNFWRKSCSKSLSLKWCRPECRRAHPRACAPPPHRAHAPPRGRTPPQAHASSQTPRPEAPHFYPAPRVAPRRSRRMRMRCAPGGLPVRLAPHRTRGCRGSAVPWRNLHRHPVVTAGRAPYLKAAPPSRARRAVPPAMDAAATEL
jgi:hypothetical protein